MKNITLSAPEELIEAARQEAKRNGTTVNEEFRKWLADKAQANRQKRTQEYDKLMAKLSYANSGGPFTREEMNER